MPAIIHQKQIIGQATEPASLIRDTVGWTCKNKLKITNDFGTSGTYTTLGVTFTRNEDLSISCSGTSTGTIYLELVPNLQLESGVKYVLSGCPRMSSSLFGLGIAKVGETMRVCDVGAGYKFVADTSRYAVDIYIASGVSTNGITFYPMIQDYRVVDTTYEPYHLTVEEELSMIEGSVSGLHVADMLYSSNWNENTYSFESIYPSDRYNIEIEPNGDIISDSQYNAWCQAKIVGMLSSNSCKALGTAPVEDIPIIVSIVGVV